MSIGKIGSIFRDPLGHFILAGLAIYLVLSFREPHEDPDAIVIGRDTLIEYIQYRSKAFDPERAGDLLERMSAAEVRDLIRQFEREEALYREARKLGLEQGDYVMRRRLVGKMEFLTDRDMPVPDPGDEALQRFIQSNLQDYAVPAAVTFTHVFVAGDRGAGADPERAARAILADLAANDAGPGDAARYGDRFLFRSHYADRDFRFVAAELGRAAAGHIFSADFPVGRWSGPVRSEYGHHVVYLTARSAARAPALAEIRDRVLDDYARTQRRELQSALEQAVVSTYRTELSPELAQWLDDRASPGADRLSGAQAGPAK